MPVTSSQDSTPDPRPVTHYMLRVTLPDERTDGTVSGLIERLGTGEKRPFASAAQLIRLVSAWPDGDA